MHKLVRGAIAGTVATIPMTLVMITLFRRLPAHQRYPLPPRLLMENFMGRVARDQVREDASLTHLTLAAHFGYGAATGVAFPFLEHDTEPQLLRGMAYGVGIWAASYLGWIPAARLLDPATRHPARRNALMLSAHLIWGTALARISAALREPEKTLRPSSHDHPRFAHAQIRLRQGERPFSRHTATPGGRSQLSPARS